MARTVHAVLTDPDEAGEDDIEIRHADSFVRVRAEEPPPRPRDREDREGSNDGS
ncbi:hypothetical protein [Dactylosporangium darangshiense]|uniref:Uncharacterized protein n=1 Tax=Dactylosporangium darangshiense TaxID=579108 RepID=A0ABP8D794_9ACTN